MKYCYDSRGRDAVLDLTYAFGLVVIWKCVGRGHTPLPPSTHYLPIYCNVRKDIRPVHDSENLLRRRTER